MKKNLSEAEKSKKVTHFRRVIKYRCWFGYVFTVVGACLFGVGFDNSESMMVTINGALFCGYGIFMVWQAKRALNNLS